MSNSVIWIPFWDSVYFYPAKLFLIKTFLIFYTHIILQLPFSTLISGNKLKSINLYLIKYLFLNYINLRIHSRSFFYYVMVYISQKWESEDFVLSKLIISEC